MNRHFHTLLIIKTNIFNLDYANVLCVYSKDKFSYNVRDDEKQKCIIFLYKLPTYKRYMYEGRKSTDICYQLGTSIYVINLFENAHVV